MLIYKILREDEWATLKAQGETHGSPADVADGYIHFSTATQLPGTLAKHYAGETPLHMLACDPESLGDKLIWEPARGGDLFPHLYRRLTLADMQWSRVVDLTEDGHQTGPLE